MANHVIKKFDRIVMLLQGGGALGSYQVGIFKGLHDAGYTPNWIISTSIGAINSAIIAGNKPDDRVKKLQEFWHTISTKTLPVPDELNNILLERFQHFLSAKCTEWIGQPGFFSPRPVSPWLSIESTADQLSYYDTEELRETLLRFINFDLINEKKIRLSMGAVRIATGNLVYFDNSKMEIKPEHVMASGALPPGFPAVRIDNQLFWDGGVHSNTQIHLLFEEDEPISTLCFMVNLFDSYGKRPTNMDDVIKRQKDISYSSHHRQLIQTHQYMHNLRHAISVLGKHIPEEQKENSKIKKLIELGSSGIIHLARFHYKGKRSDLSSKDYEFSLPSILDHFDAGYADVERALREPLWYQPFDDTTGLIVHELSDNPTADDFPFDINLYER
ncbi:MAG: hypothetical protein A3F12_06540 [Gammaproteobacteria bacterium RIFCSPHIGHO2_12_FULL_38_14]|nr:MAG: hypothetical protein A3F12_06540 [Gammaproteobacteria bacterium RIFCSPHIGHO2_12_FULL_38_14]